MFDLASKLRALAASAAITAGAILFAVTLVVTQISALEPSSTSFPTQAMTPSGGAPGIPAV